MSGSPTCYFSHPAMDSGSLKAFKAGDNHYVVRLTWSDDQVKRCTSFVAEFKTLGVDDKINAVNAINFAMEPRTRRNLIKAIHLLKRLNAEKKDPSVSEFLLEVSKTDASPGIAVIQELLEKGCEFELLSPETEHE